MAKSRLVIYNYIPMFLSHAVDLAHETVDVLNRVDLFVGRPMAWPLAGGRHFVGEPLAAPSDLRPRAWAFPSWDCLAPSPNLTTVPTCLACPRRTKRTRCNHMTEACEASCKQGAQDTPPFHLLSYHSPSLFISLFSSGPLPYSFIPFSHPPTPLFIISHVGVEEALGVSHWLPHRTFAQGPGHSLHGIALPLPPT
jgi:hypothetical protein